MTDERVIEARKALSRYEDRNSRPNPAHLADAVRGLLAIIDEAHTPTDDKVAPDEREALRRAVQSVTWNASNYPRKAQPHILGADIAPITDSITDAVLAEAREAITEHLASCEWSQGEPSDARIRQAVLEGLAEAAVLQSPFQPQTRELVVEQITLALRAGGVR